MTSLTYEALNKQDASTTNAIIDELGGLLSFGRFADTETTGILARDAEDAEKLAAGIQQAVAKGVLAADPPVETTTKIDVLGKSVEEVVALITAQLGDAPATGCIFVLSGLSGTGKGTTVAKLEQTLPRATSWSNGNIFRSITLLALEHCASEDIEFSEAALTPSLLASLFAKLEFGKVGDRFDTKLHVSDSQTLLISEVQNTLLKEARIGKNIPTVAQLSQGEVVQFAARAAEIMRADGMNVLIEGRSQTLDYVRTPHRFELTLSDASIIGKRRAAQRMMAAALKTLAPTATVDEVRAALEAALNEMVGSLPPASSTAVTPATPAAPASAPPPPPPPPPPSAEDVASKRRLILEYAEKHQLEASISAALRDVVISRPMEPRLAIAASLAAPVPGAADWLHAQLALDGKLPAYDDSVLGGCEVKCDEFADIHKLTTARLHPAVWNLRRVQGSDVFGVGQCHLEGLQYLCGHFHSLGFPRVIWLNMREEPVVFLGGQACGLRLASELNENIDYLTDIHGAELAIMEIKLREECVEMASIYQAADGATPTMNVYYQIEGGGNEERPVTLAPETTLSVAEAYAYLNQRSPVPIEYHRLPIADENAPSELILTSLVEIMRPLLAPGTRTPAIVFNCQMGRGRTTTGMVCATIMLKVARGWTMPDNAAPSLPSADDDAGRDLARGEFKGVMRLLVQLGEILTASKQQSLLGRRSSMRAKPVDQGVQTKLLADEAITDCAEVQHLVTAITQCVDSAAKADPGSNRPPAFWTHRAHAYLERYAFIIIFAAYALAEADDHYATPFSTWLRRHWSLRRTLKSLALE